MVPPLKHLFTNNKEQIDKWYYEQGLTQEQIAKKLGCCKNTAQKYLNKLFPIKYKGHRRIFQHKRKKLETLYIDEAKSCVKIADMMGCSRELATKYLNQLFPNTERYSAGRVAEANKDTIIELYENNKKAKEIAEHFNKLSEKSVLKYLKKWGIEVRTAQDYTRIWSDWTRESNKVRRRVNDFYNHTCNICGEKQDPYSPNYNMQLHHTWGDKVKVFLLCRKCHVKKHWSENGDLKNQEHNYKGQFIGSLAKWSDFVKNKDGVNVVYKRVYEFYEHTCQKCGTKKDPNSNTYDLETHHKWENPVIETLLCKKCHKETHK